MSAATATQSVEGSRRLLAVVSVAFFAMGMVTAAMGPLLPDLARQTNASLVAAGGALAAQFGGSLVGYSVAALTLRRIGRRRMLIAGMSAFIVAAVGLATSRTLPALVGAAGFMGVGYAAVALAGNIIAAESSAGAGPLNFVNAAFGLGAIVSAALIGVSIESIGTGLPGLWAVPCVMAVGLALVLLWASKETDDRSTTTRRAPAVHHSPLSALASPLLWTFCAFMFASSSSEACLNGWLPTFLERSASIPLAVGAWALSWVWVLMTAMRFLAAWASRRVEPWTILRICIGFALCGGALAIACAILQSPVLGFAATTLFGLALGPIMPTLFGELSASFPQDTGVATGLMMAAGSVGGASVPWTLGALTVSVGPVAGAAVLLALPLAMAALLAAIERQTGADAQ